jgi:hypothetical protein
MNSTLNSKILENIMQTSDFILRNLCEQTRNLCIKLVIIKKLLKYKFQKLSLLHWQG